jgi:predicted flap endonuclease-1-like 5' DNA nuclease
VPAIDLDDLADLDTRRDDRRPGGRLVAALALLVLAAVAVVTYRVVAILLEGRRGEADARRQLAGVAANESRTGTPSVGASAVDGGDPGDDLKVIEGIGPRFESVLKSAGIRTYGELADTRAGRIETILREAGGRMADPTTWPAQARLAADGQWQELSEMQSMLKGGRRAN